MLKMRLKMDTKDQCSLLIHIGDGSRILMLSKTNAKLKRLPVTFLQCITSQNLAQGAQDPFIFTDITSECSHFIL